MHGAGTGGVEKSLGTLCKYINKDKFHVMVALPSEGPLKTYLDDLGIRTFIAPIDLWTPIQFLFDERHYYRFLSSLKERVRNLVKIIKENRIDIVHSATLAVADGAFAAKIAGRPHIWHIHGVWGQSVETTKEYGSYLPIETLFALVSLLSTKVIAVSEDVKKFLERYLPEDNVQVIYNGIDLKKFDENVARPSTIRNEFHLNGKYVVAMVGRIAEVKGVEDYIESAIKVLKKRDDVAFLIVGPEEDKDLVNSMKNQVKSMNLSNSIVFTGMRNDIPSILHESDIFTCSSKTEGFPYSCLEAMSASKPVITTRCGGPEEIVIDGVTGFHVNVGSPDEIAKSVISLLDNKELIKSMGLKSREVVEERFCAEVFARNFEDVYSSLYTEYFREEFNPWAEVALNLVSNIGDLGTRTRQLEHKVRDLRNFEALFKTNFFYRTLKKCYRFLKTPSKT